MAGSLLQTISHISSSILLHFSCPVPDAAVLFLSFLFNSFLTPTFANAAILISLFLTFLSFVSTFLSAPFAFGRLEKKFTSAFLNHCYGTTLLALPIRIFLNSSNFLSTLIGIDVLVYKSILFPGILVWSDPLLWPAHSYSILITFRHNFPVLHTFSCFESKYLRN